MKKRLFDENGNLLDRCDVQRIREDKLDEILQDQAYTRALLKNAEQTKAQILNTLTVFRGRVNQFDLRKLAKVDKEIELYETRKRNLLDLYADGKISTVDLDDRYDEYNVQLEQLYVLRVEYEKDTAHIERDIQDIEDVLAKVEARIDMIKHDIQNGTFHKKYSRDELLDMIDSIIVQPDNTYEYIFKYGKVEEDSTLYQINIYDGEGKPLGCINLNNIRAYGEQVV